MSPSSRESNLAQFRESLLQLNTQLCMIVSERRFVSQKIQDLKGDSGRFARFDPEREKVIFEQLKDHLSELTIKELLAFSIIMEDQAMAMAPGSYPSWSTYTHLISPIKEPYGQINPLLIKMTHPEIFSLLSLTSEFSFLKDF